MHRTRKSKHRQMLKPKFGSSSSDEDEVDDVSSPVKWKQVQSSSGKRFVGVNNATSIQKLSSEVIRKEEIYNQAEMEANKKMFGCENPGRCLSKDEIKSRKDIILQIVNQRLKSKLSQLMGEFDVRISNSSRYEYDETMRDGDRYQDDDDDDDIDIPEAPPPPTFHTSEESSESELELDVSMTKEFESYEKEIKEKISTTTTNGLSTISSSFDLSTSNTVDPMNSQQNWLQSSANQQWTVTDQSTVWIPPVGLPQVMEPFPPPLRSEQMPFMPLPQQFSTFPTANHIRNPIIPWPNVPPPAVSTILTSNFGTALQQPQWKQQMPSTPFESQIPTQSQTLVNQSAFIQKWNPLPNSYIRPLNVNQTLVRPSNVSETLVRPNTAVNSVRNSLYTSSNNESVLSKSTNVNTVSTAQSENVTSNHAKKSPVDESHNELNRNVNNNFNLRKRHDDRIANDIDCASGNSRESINRLNKRARFDDFNTKTNRNDQTQRNQNSRKPFELQVSKIVESDAKAKFWNAKNRNAAIENSKNDRTNVSIEWTRLCDIVNQLLDLQPSIVAELPLTDIRLKERNEILLTLSDDPSSLYAYVDKYGERNVTWATKMAQRVLYPQGRYSDTVALTIAPFQKAIHNALDTFKSSVQPKPIEPKTQLQHRPVPKEWKQLCEIVDKVLNIPTNIMERLLPSDSRVRERNDILMMLSNDPEDFLLHDEKYGARNVDSSILAAKNILYPDGMPDERVRKIMLRQRELLTGNCTASNDRSISRDRESSGKRSNHKSSTACGSAPDEWTKLCDIVDKVLDTPKEVRIKMSKRDPRWEQRENILLILSDDPDKLESYSDELGRSNVDWAIKSSKKILYPNGSRDRTVFEKFFAQRKQLLSSRRSESERSSSSSKAGREKQKSSRGEQLSVQTVEKNGNSNIETPIDKEIDATEVWSKLCTVVDKLLDIPANEAEKLDHSDKRLIERNDILMVLSDDPEMFSKFEANYGSTNVAWAIKVAKKLIYSNGKPNEKLTNALWQQRDAIMRSEEGPNDSSDSHEWKFIRKIATKMFLLSCKSINNEKKLTKEQLHQLNELLLQLTDNPDVVRSEPICKKIGDGCVEAAIAKCKHILNRMRSSDPNALHNFENIRYKMVLYTESLNQSKNIKNYDVILTEVRKIVDRQIFNEIYGQTFNKWTNEQKLERNELAILLIKDPKILRSNGKYSEMIRKPEKAAVVDGIVAEIEKCLLKCEYVKEAPRVTCAPIIARIRDEKFMSPFKEKKLTQRIHRLIEQFLIDPKPEVFDIHWSPDGLDIVCANKMTYEWLKASISELNGLWDNAKLSVCKAQITHKVLDPDDLKEIKMMLKTVPNESFSVVMRQLKMSNAKLNTEKWQLVPSSTYNPKKMFVMVDLESMVELERSKREVIVESGIVYFDIKYIGQENF